jgi:4-amino-4-deoxychorismate lyase
MSLLLESIKVINGKVCNLPFHERRANRSRKILFGLARPLNLKKAIVVPEEFKKGLVKCRMIYGESIESVSFIPYSAKKIHSAKIIVSDQVSYSHKYEKRPELDDLYSKKGDHDEIIIIKNGFVTDAYYYNVVFEKNGKFITSDTPLLRGIQRERLIHSKKVQVIPIRIEDISSFDRVHFVNALNGLGKCVIPVSQVSY